MPTSPCAVAIGAAGGAGCSNTDDCAELLGSLTTQQQQRTSARVIKKLRLDDAIADRDKKELPESDSGTKLDEKDPNKISGVKQRMPKALWSTDEKNLFFEALNEFGKDFDAITTHICAKMKKKGVSDSNMKTKHQVSHFYYRTWHKLSKHVNFDENVKKVAQELYALINYGELRRKLSSVNEKTCTRLGEMISRGCVAVRARGRNLRVRTPMCRALRRLNQMTERTDCARVGTRALVLLRARDCAAWARVQAAAHNPRAATSVPLRTTLYALLTALQRRWSGRPSSRRDAPFKISNFSVAYTNSSEIHASQLNKVQDTIIEDDLREFMSRSHWNSEDKDSDDLDNHLNMEPERIIVLEQQQPKKLALHVGPRPNTDIHLPTISPSEPLSSQTICFSSYLERMGSSQRRSDKLSCTGKIRTPKRLRKDSTTEKEKEGEQKRFKLEDSEIPKLIDIEETAIDGIELMASLSETRVNEDEKPSTEEEHDVKTEESNEEQIEIKDTEVNKDVVEKEVDKDVVEKEVCDKELLEREKDSFSEMEDDEKFNKSDTDNESDVCKGEKQHKETKFKNLKVKFRIRPKKRGGSIYTLISDMEQTVKEANSVDDQNKNDSTALEVSERSVPKANDVDLEMTIRQVRKGWSMYDAGQLTIGDLYLMFGSRSKLELDYWWEEPTPPLPQSFIQQRCQQTVQKTSHIDNTDKTSLSEKPIDKEKTIGEKKGGEKKDEKSTPEKGTDSSMEDEKEKAREIDTDIFSPKNTFSQDSNDGLSGDERKSEPLASPEHKTQRVDAYSAPYRIANKLINRPDSNIAARNAMQHEQVITLTSRLRRLLALVEGHACQQQKKRLQQEKQFGNNTNTIEELTAPVFRHPTPIAPKRDEASKLPTLGLTDLPRWRRGRPRRVDDSQVVVQRLLPLLPKPSPTHNLIPVKIVSKPSTMPLTRILPKPPPISTSSSGASYVYVLSENGGQFYLQEGGKRVPLLESPLLESDDGKDGDDDEIKREPPSEPATPAAAEPEKQTELISKTGTKCDVQENFTSFLPSESMSIPSMSPSRLLRDSDGQWLESEVQDFSLSSFLGHLEGAGPRPPSELAVDSQLQSLMAESSVDYVAKFADLAAEVASDTNEIPGVRDESSGPPIT